jgi:dTDP-4-dehydrorhamnose 3,5-epimerase
MMSMVFEFRPLSNLPELILIEPSTLRDERGWFREEYKRSDFEKRGIGSDFPQDNQSYSMARGTLRGLHFQKMPMTQGKLVTCLSGEVFDVAADIRIGSPTYSHWASVSLTSENHRILWIPPGFAHGFQTMAENTTVMYKVTREYSAAHERSIRWNDPEIGIRWPIDNPILSKKDADAPLLKEVDNNLEWRKETGQDSN